MAEESGKGNSRERERERERESNKLTAPKHHRATISQTRILFEKELKYRSTARKKIHRPLKNNKQQIQEQRTNNSLDQ